MQGKKLGMWGEGKAAIFLERKGFKIVERNYRCRFGEIDLVAKDRRDWVFVEVKTRRGTNFGLPCEAVTRVKREHLRRSAWCYVLSHELIGVDLRMDVVEVLLWEEKVWIRHTVNAF